MAEERAEKAKYLEDKKTAETDLAQARERISVLESENNNLSGTVTTLRDNVSKLFADLDSSHESRSRLTSVIKVIEQEKAGNFESGLVLARRHTEAYPGWERINWSRFRVPPSVKVLVPPYFFQPGKIKDVMDQSNPTDPKDPHHS